MAGTGKKDNKSTGDRAGHIVLAAAVLGLFFWYRVYLTASFIPSVDLPGHIALTARLRESLKGGTLFFFDRFWFSGWPAFHFYGFAAHLLAAVLSWPLSLFSASPVALSVNFCIVFGLALFPVSVHYAAAPLRLEMCKNNARFLENEGLLFALVVSVLTFWYLNLDYSFYGIGAGAVVHAGLYPQLLGQHLFLLYLGTLYRLLLNPDSKNEWMSAIFLATLILTHLLSAFFCLCVGMLVWLRFSGIRWTVFKIHLAAVLICGFWLVPLMVYLGGFTASDPELAGGDLLSILFRYPWRDLPALLGSLFGTNMHPFNPVHVVMVLLLAVLLGSDTLGRCRIAMNFTLFTLILSVFFSSSFAPAGLPVGLHYYRFYPFLLLMLLSLLSVVPSSFLIKRGEAVEKFTLPAARSLILAFSLISLAATAMLPNRELSIVKRTDFKQRFSKEDEVIEYLGSLKNPGRIFFEFYSDRTRFSLLSPHYMYSRLYQKTRLESLNGLFIQSSIIPLFTAAASNSLGIRAYASPFPLSDPGLENLQSRLKQLRDFGITHLVLTDGKAYQLLKSYTKSPPVEIGPYRILAIASSSQASAAYIDKLLIGYKDKKGTLSFKQLEYYFASRPKLAAKYEVIQIEKGKPHPPGLTLTLVNGRKEGTGSASSNRERTVFFDFTPLFPVDHYYPRFETRRETSAFLEIQKFLDKSIYGRLIKDVPGKILPAAKLTPKLTWSENGQAFHLTGLVPWRLLRINYSYFPYWSPSNGSVYRGFGDRIYFLPEKEEAYLTFSRWSSGWTWAGMAVSIIGVLCMWLNSRRAPIQGFEVP